MCKIWETCRSLVVGLQNAPFSPIFASVTSHASVYIKKKNEVEKNKSHCETRWQNKNALLFFFQVIRLL